MRLFVFIAISIFICSCNKAVLKNATIETKKPPNIYGNNRALEAGHHASVSAELNTSRNDIKTTVHGDVTGNDEKVLADYRLIEDTWGLQAYYINKRKNDFYFGGGAGAQGFPYAFLNIGINKRLFEIGHAILLGIRVSKIDYDGYYEGEDGENIGDFSNTKYFNSMNAYFYTSVFLERFALNYVFTYSSQEHFFSHDKMVDVNLGDLDLFIQDIGIVYAGNRIKYRVGLNQIRGYHLPKRYWGTSFHLAWLW